MMASYPDFQYRKPGRESPISIAFVVRKHDRGLETGCVILPSLKLTARPKNGAFQYQSPTFRGELLVSGRVVCW